MASAPKRAASTIAKVRLSQGSSSGPISIDVDNVHSDSSLSTKKRRATQTPDEADWKQSGDEESSCSSSDNEDVVASTTASSSAAVSSNAIILAPKKKAPRVDRSLNERDIGAKMLASVTADPYTISQLKAQVNKSKACIKELESKHADSLLKLKNENNDLRRQLDNVSNEVHDATIRTQSRAEYYLKLLHLIGNKWYQAKALANHEHEWRTKLEGRIKNIYTRYFVRECCMGMCDEDARFLLHECKGDSGGHYLCAYHYQGLCSQDDKPTIKCPKCRLECPNGEARLQNAAANLKNFLVDENDIHSKLPSEHDLITRTRFLGDKISEYHNGLSSLRHHSLQDMLPPVFYKSDLEEVMEATEKYKRSVNGYYDSDLDVDHRAGSTRHNPGQAQSVASVNRVNPVDDGNGYGEEADYSPPSPTYSPSS